MLQVEHLTKRYGAVTAVDDLSFEIAGAGVYGFLGPNGAGKSTTMNIMTGCLSATAGTVKISGYDIYESPREAKRRVGYLPEQPPLCLGETPTEFLRFVGEAKGLRGAELRRQIDAVVEETGIGDMRQRRISALSKGYRQRVGIAQALLGEPDTVILDEPTVGLDPIQILEIRALIAALGESRVAEAQFLHLRALPAQHGVDAGQELARLEGLGEVVVRAGVQTLHPVVEAGARREHEYGRPHAPRPQPPRELKAVEARKHHVEHDEVADAAQRILEPGGPVIGRLGLKAVLREQLAERFREQPLVFNYKYGHRNSPA